MSQTYKHIQWFAMSGSLVLNAKKSIFVIKLIRASNAAVPMETLRCDVTWCAASQINIDFPFKLNYVVAHRHGDMCAVHSMCRVTCTGCCVQEFNTTHLLQIRVGSCVKCFLSERNPGIQLQFHLCKWNQHNEISISVFKFCRIFFIYA